MPSTTMVVGGRHFSRFDRCIVGLLLWVVGEPTKRYRAGRQDKQAGSNSKLEIFSLDLPNMM